MSRKRTDNPVNPTGKPDGDRGTGQRRQWTPGPWRAAGASMRGLILAGGEPGQPGQPDSVLVASVIDRRTNWDFELQSVVTTLEDRAETEANASLIAAAPDLYEALVECSSCLSAMAYHDPEAVEQARAALAKASPLQSPAKPSGKPVKRTGRPVSKALTGDEAEAAGREEYKRVTEGE